MMRKLLHKELVSLKRQKFTEKYHIQRIQQLLDGEIDFENWRNTGQMITRKEWDKYYKDFSIFKPKTKTIFRYGGGVGISLMDSGRFYCPYPIEKEFKSLTDAETHAYEFIREITV